MYVELGMMHGQFWITHGGLGVMHGRKEGILGVSDTEVLHVCRLVMGPVGQQRVTEIWVGLVRRIYKCIEEILVCGIIRRM
jgi:hypothetical protein